jgi:hypothetical protein
LAPVVYAHLLPQSEDLVDDGSNKLIDYPVAQNIHLNQAGGHHDGEESVVSGNHNYSS